MKMGLLISLFLIIPATLVAEEFVNVDCSELIFKINICANADIDSNDGVYAGKSEIEKSEFCSNKVGSLICEQRCNKDRSGAFQFEYTNPADNLIGYICTAVNTLKAAEKYSKDYKYGELKYVDECSKFDDDNLKPESGDFSDRQLNELALSKDEKAPKKISSNRDEYYCFEWECNCTNYGDSEALSGIIKDVFEISGEETVLWPTGPKRQQGEKGSAFEKRLKAYLEKLQQVFDRLRPYEVWTDPEDNPELRPESRDEYK